MAQITTYYQRMIDSSLDAWASSVHHKPLLLRGARQVGKSSAVEALARRHFTNYIEVNFEKEPSLSRFFDGDIDVKRIVAQLSARYQTPLISGGSLLFLDEIQNCPRAISALRYFYEDMPELHVVAAGSLLEFALAEIPAFGVGRIQSLYMYPFSFYEYLGVVNPMLQQALQADEHTILDSEPIHKQLILYLRDFMLIGGMPEVVRQWHESGSYLDCQNILADIIKTYTDDFAKYKTRVSPLLLRQAFASVANQAGHKFVYTTISQGINSIKAKEIIELLRMAGLIIPVVHSAANGIPLGAEVNPKFQKLLPMDTGIMLYQLGLNLGKLLQQNDVELVCKGSLAEVFAGLELCKHSNPRIPVEMYYWLHIKPNAQAEIDYLVTQGDQILPVEVKAGTRGAMQSLYYFLDQKQLPFGIRSSLEPFGELEKVHIIPLYALGTWYSRNSR